MQWVHASHARLYESGIRKSIPVSVSERHTNDTFNDTVHDNIYKHRAILTQKWEQLFNKVDVLSLFNSIILKVMHHEQYIKRLIGKKGNSLAAFYLKKWNFLLYTIKYVDI